MKRPDVEHYNYSPIEPWDVIRHWGLNFFLGNVAKYICRAGRKSVNGDPAAARLTDLRKARDYLIEEIRNLEGSVG